MPTAPYTIKARLNESDAAAMSTSSARDSNGWVIMPKEPSSRIRTDDSTTTDFSAALADAEQGGRQELLRAVKLCVQHLQTQSRSIRELKNEVTELKTANASLRRELESAFKHHDSSNGVRNGMSDQLHPDLRAQESKERLDAIEDALQQGHEEMQDFVSAQMEVNIEFALQLRNVAGGEDVDAGDVGKTPRLAAMKADLSKVISGVSFRLDGVAASVQERISAEAISKTLRAASGGDDTCVVSLQVLEDKLKAVKAGLDEKIRTVEKARNADAEENLRILSAIRHSDEHDLLEHIEKANAAIREASSTISNDRCGDGDGPNQVNATKMAFLCEHKLDVLQLKSQDEDDEMQIERLSEKHHAAMRELNLRCRTFEIELAELRRSTNAKLTRTATELKLLQNADRVADKAAFVAKLAKDVETVAVDLAKVKNAGARMSTKLDAATARCHQAGKALREDAERVSISSEALSDDVVKLNIKLADLSTNIDAHKAVVLRALGLQSPKLDGEREQQDALLKEADAVCSSIRNCRHSVRGLPLGRSFMRP